MAARGRSKAERARARKDAAQAVGKRRAEARGAEEGAGSAGGGGAPAATEAELEPGARFAQLALAWTVFVASGPGVLGRDGSPYGAAAGVALWAVAAARPGRRAFLVEAVVGALAWAWIVHWSAYVFWFCLVWMGVGLGLWQAATGALLRRLGARTSLAFAVPAAWLAVETLKTITPTPLGLSWMRLGAHLHASPLVESARLWGSAGLSLALAAPAGLAAELWLRRRRATRTSLAVALGWGLGPLALAFLVPHVVARPATVPGPRVLCVQPAIPQERKHRAGSAADLFYASVDLTRSAVDAAAANHARDREPLPDLVLWGETMLMTSVVESGLDDALRNGLAVPPWRAGFDAQSAADLAAHEEDVLSVFYDRRRGVLPPGTSFASGVDLWRTNGDRLGRQNAVMLWDADAERVGWGAKRELVPGAETLLGLEGWETGRAIIDAIAGYVPDLVRAERTAVLAFEARDGRRFGFGVTVCFDNAYDYPYTEPLRAARAGGPDVDFFVVASNEGWFLESLELDQMVAFSRVLAAATARSIVRATNSGVTCVIGPDGREIARLEVGGRDRLVAGALRATVPVPRREPAGDALEGGGPGAAQTVAPTPFVRWEHAWNGFWILGPLLGLARRRRVETKPPHTA